MVKNPVPLKNGQKPSPSETWSKTQSLSKEVKNPVPLKKGQKPSPSSCSKTQSLKKPGSKTQSLPKIRSKTQSLKNPVAQKPSRSKTQSLKSPKFRRAKSQKPSPSIGTVQKPSPSRLLLAQKPSRSKTQSQRDWVFEPCQSRDWVFVILANIQKIKIKPQKPKVQKYS